MLKKIMSFNVDYRDKWYPNYEGAYVVKKAFSGGALILKTMDGEEFPRPMNAGTMKKFFTKIIKRITR